MNNENESTQWIITIRKDDYSNLVNALMSIQGDFKKIVITEVKEDIRIAIKFNCLISFEAVSSLFNCLSHKEQINFKFEKVIYFDK